MGPGMMDGALDNVWEQQSGGAGGGEANRGRPARPPALPPVAAKGSEDAAGPEPGALEGLFDQYAEPAPPSSPADETVGSLGAPLGIEPGGVRLRTDGKAEAEADAMGARAFTRGGDIAFARGAYAPHTAEGQKLIAHELVHVAQQRQGSQSTQMKSAVSQPNEPAEVEADAAADALVSGRGPVEVRASADPGRAHRKPEESAAAPAPGSAQIAKAKAEIASATAMLSKIEKLPGDLPEGGLGTADEMAAKIKRVEAEHSQLAPQVAVASSGIWLQYALASVEAAQAGVPPPAALEAVKAGVTSLMSALAAATSKVQARLSSARIWETDLRQKEASKAEALKTPKLSGSHAKEDEGPGGKSKIEASGELDEGKLKGGVKGSSETVDPDEKKKTNDGAGMTGQVSADGAGAGVSHEHKQTHGYDEEYEKKRQKEIEEFELKKARGEVPADAKFEGSPEKKYASDSHKTNVGGEVDWVKGTGAVSGSHERTHTNEDGSSTSKTGSAKVGVDAEGNVNVEAGGGYASKDAEGKVKTQVGGSIGVDKNGVTVKGEVGTEGVGASGEVIYKDGEKGVKGKLKIGGESKSFSVGGGHVVKFTPVTQVGEHRFAVTCSVMDEVSVGGAAKSGGTGPGVGAGASIESGHVQSRTRVFATAEEADAFRSAENVPGDMTLPRSPAAARSLKPGEAVEDGTSQGLGANLSGSGAGVTVGVSGSVKDSKATRVEHMEGNLVRARQTVRQDKSGGLSLGNFVTVGESADGFTLRTLAVEVDLGPAESPDHMAEAAYGVFMATGTIVPPARKVFDQVKTGSGSTTSIGGGAGGMGVSLTNRSETTESVTHDESGKTEESTGKHTKGVSINLPFIGGSLEESTALRAVEVNDEKRGYSVEVNINDSSASDTMRALSEATGTHQDYLGVRENDKAKTSGTWTVQSQVSVKAVDKLIEAVKSGKFDPRFTAKGKDGEYEGNSYTAGAEFAEAVKKAGDDPDALRRALAKFVAEGGEKAVKQLRGYGGEEASCELTLTKDGKVDPHFRGIEGRIEADAKIADFEKRVSGAEDEDKRGLAMEIKGFMAQIRGRIGALSPEAYPDLPPDLLSREVSKSQADLARLEPILAKARDGVPKEDKPQRRRISRHKTDEEVLGEQPKSDLETGGKDLQASPQKQAQKMGLLSSNKSLAQQRQAAARQKRHGHLVGFQNGKQRPRAHLESDEGDLYTSSDGKFNQALGLWGMALSNENLALSMPDFTEAEIARTLGMIDAAANTFMDAAMAFGAAASTLDAIEQANPKNF